MHGTFENNAKTARPQGRIYRGKLRKLCIMRYGNHFLPDNADGRAMLVALLRCGLKPESAAGDAPWLTDDELKTLRHRARKAVWDDLGTLIGLTYAEREAGKLWFLLPCDVSRDEVRRRQSEKRDKSDRERKRQQQREHKETMQRTSCRLDAILRMLSEDWVPVSALVKQAEHCKAFRRPDGQPVGLSWQFPRRTYAPDGRLVSASAGRSGSLRVVVHQVLDQLEERGQIETVLRPGVRGQVRFVRKINLTASANNFGSQEKRTEIVTVRQLSGSQRRKTTVRQRLRA